MREILFRGFCEHTKSWIVGSYVKAELLTVKSEYEHFIIEIASDGAEFEVLPETVGQYTGLKDKNGNRIFEGDVVRFEDYTNFEGDTNEFLNEGTVEYEQFGFYFTNRSTVNMEDFYINDKNEMEDVEIIGNIHDKD